MTNSQVSKLLVLADIFVLKLADEKGTVVLEDKNNINKQFQAQREMLEKFSHAFRSKFRAIIGELESDIGTLKTRKFDPKMLQLMLKTNGDLEKIYQSMKDNKPYAIAQKLVDYVADQTSTIDNLDFLIQHHLQKTQPEMKVPLLPVMRHAQAKAFRELKELAHQLKHHMDNNPLLSEPISIPPPAEPNPMADPSFLAPPDVATKA
jgi:DNA-directed RNA polymerase subunit F